MKSKIKFLLATIMMLVGVTATHAEDITSNIRIDVRDYCSDDNSTVTSYFQDEYTVKEGVVVTFRCMKSWDETITIYLNGTAVATWPGDAGGSKYVWTAKKDAKINWKGYAQSSANIYLTETATVAVTGVTLAPTSATLTLGETETVTLIPTVLPGDATDKSVTWSSSNEAVATVADGVVTAVAAGEATITVTTTDGEFTATCAVTVAAPAAATYTVTLKEGTEDANSWTIAPPEATTTGVAQGTQVTASYGGVKKVKSVKAVKKAPAGPPSWKLTLSSPAKDLYITANGGLIAQHTLDVASTEFTVEMPELTSQTVNIVATDGSGNCWYCTQENMSFAIGQTYQSSPTMTALGTESSADVYKMTEAGTIPDGKTVVLSGVTISNGQIACSGDATIILMGTNTVTANAGKAAIKIGGSGTTLTITGSGSLTATGGNGGAGIGTDKVTSGGTLSGGNIVINGGTVTATGGDAGAGIGTGLAQLTNTTNTCGDITINGGTVTATGGNNGGAGIGTGRAVMASNTCGAITIGTGVISVTAKKSSSNPAPNSIGIGGILGSCTQACGTITIGGTIYWDGSAYQNGGDTYLTNNITYPTAP